MSLGKAPTKTKFARAKSRANRPAKPGNIPSGSTRGGTKQEEAVLATLSLKARTFSSCSSPTGPWRIYPLDDAGDGGALFADLARAADDRDLVDEALHQDVHENHRPPVRNNRTVEETLAGRLSQGSKGSSGKARKTA